MKGDGSNYAKRTRRRKPNATSAWSKNTEHGNMPQTSTSFETETPRQTINRILEAASWRVLTEEEVGQWRALTSLLGAEEVNKIINPTTLWNREHDSPPVPKSEADRAGAESRSDQSPSAGAAGPLRNPARRDE